MIHVFGESLQKARHSYHCDICHKEIEEGEQYRRWIWKVDTRRVHVMREHLGCHPDDPLGDEESTSLDDDYTLPLAA